MHRNRNAQLACAGLVALALAACQQKEPAPTAAPPEQPAPTPAPTGEVTAGPRPAALQPELLRVAQLPAESSPHWVWVHDMNFDSMIDGRSRLVDAEAGSVLGMISTGFGGAGLVPNPQRHELYSIETYYARGARGERTDVVSIYEPLTLTPVAEIVIPPKRISSMPMLGNWRVTDDGRYLLVFNLTPATSVAVVDLESRSVLSEIETPGCSLIYPGPGRRFVMLCGDGRLLDIEFDQSGAERRKERTEKFFDPATDPVTEKAVRRGNTWYFYTFGGMVHALDLTEGLTFGEPWSLLDDQARGESWLPGGLQPTAVHAASGQLYVIMHQGGPGSHKDPGGEVWVYDLATRKRLNRIVLAAPAMSVQVSQDEAPLLYTAFMGSGDLEVYDARSGEHLRTVPQVGLTPGLLITP